MLGRIAGFTLLVSSCVVFADDITPLQIALEKQAQFKTVSVDVRQTKRVPALTESSVQHGHLWMEPGKSFRWELGKPLVQTAVYNGSTVWLMDESKKTGMELTPDDRRAKPILLMLGIGEGATSQGLQEGFNVQATNLVGEQFVVSLSPKGGLKRALSSMVLQVNTRTSFLERIEWTQRDGTVVITEFSAPVVNKPLPAGMMNIKRDSYTWEK